MSVLSIANGIDVSLVPCGFRGAAYSLLSTYSDAGKFPIVFLTESSTTLPGPSNPNGTWREQCLGH